MIKFRLKYGIELSLNGVHQEDCGTIQWFFPHVDLEYFKDELVRKIDSKIGAYGHGVSSTSIRAIDFLIVIKQLLEWNPVLIEGSEIDGLIPGLDLPNGAVS